MTPQEQKKIIEQIQADIKSTVPENLVDKNTAETRLMVKSKLLEVLQKYNLPEVAVICDGTNNNRRMIEAKQFQADIIIKFDLKQKGGHKIQLKGGRKNPFQR